jgi:hypothetical protein
MGWTGTHKEKGQSLFDFFKRELGEGLIDISQKGWSTAYAAYRTKDGKVCGFVIHIQNNPRDYFNFTYKEVDEGMGPYECECPKRILDLLSPSEDLYTGSSLEYSKRWRDECRKNLERKKTLPKVSTGARYEMITSMRFTNGMTLTPGDKVICLDARKRQFSPEGTGGVRLRFGQNAAECIKVVG